MITRQQLKLMEFAESVLECLERHKEWDAYTTDEIGVLAQDMGLAETGLDGSFKVKDEFAG